ncbi:hypothetical protein [Pseudomonas typographi]|uniref:hypothetical protein n=1 Tax=Pseudomonas typographi TaxID=2715964 RepID=UPI001687D18A|nr:hypothetical protein [Pseudomonas typographi]MBD1589765.1 hypothetical protein [Pseudomonas typographi]
MIYTSVLAAVVSALAAESKGNTKGAAWQKLYDASEEKQRDLSSLVKTTGFLLSRELVDNWIAARLHHLLTPRHWYALVAKYSTDKAKVVDAIAHIKPVIATPAPQLFLFKAVTAWAVPKLPGARVKRTATVSVDVPLDAPEWRRLALVNAAVQAGKASRRTEQSRAAGVIVLPDSYYDMSTWDPDASPESTRRRWRLDIYEKLDGLVTDALAHAEQILKAEGVLMDAVA